MPASPAAKQERSFDPFVFGVSATMFLLLLVLYGTFKGLSEYRKAEAEGYG